MSGIVRSYQWVRLYTEILDDPKMVPFSDGQFRFWISMLCLARASKVPGFVAMDAGQIAWRIRRSPEFVAEGLGACLDAGLVVMATGGFELPKFSERNADRRPEDPAAVAGRARNYRLRKAVTQRHATVTQPVTPCRVEESTTIGARSAAARTANSVLADRGAKQRARKRAPR